KDGRGHKHYRAEGPNTGKIVLRKLPAQLKPPGAFNDDRHEGARQKKTRLPPPKKKSGAKQEGWRFHYFSAASPSGILPTSNTRNFSGSSCIGPGSSSCFAPRSTITSTSTGTPSFRSFSTKLFLGSSHCNKIKTQPLTASMWSSTKCSNA